VAWQHVVGAFDVGWAADTDPGTPLAQASNRVRGAIERAAGRLTPERGALFRGLVVGDDRDQSPDTIEVFRASGLSHLTAVSGQNVAFLLAAAGPMLVRLRPLPRWLLTLGLIAWFVSLTRFEPSIVRAGTMAAFSATAYLVGAVGSAVRNLGLAVIVLVLVDPLIVGSIGFWLSVGATLGVTAVGSELAGLLPGSPRLATPVAVTLGAQVGVALPALLVFGRLPLVSVPANLLAVPVAGAVMLYGLPAGLVAGTVDPLAPVLMAPAGLGVWWVDLIAHRAASLEPSPGWSLVGWSAILVLTVLTVLHRRFRMPQRPARN
jgi:competence protein ComEC